MKRFQNHLLAAIGGVCVLTTLVLFTSRSGHTAGGAVAVQVTNTPLPTINTDNPARQPFQYTLTPGSATSSSATDSYSVPAGKRLVIEYISAQLTQYPASGYGYLYLITTAGGNQAYYKVVPPISSTVPQNQSLRIYADPGTSVQASVTQSSGTSCGGNLILSGYLVNLP